MSEYFDWPKGVPRFGCLPCGYMFTPDTATCPHTPRPEGCVLAALEKLLAVPQPPAEP